MFRPLPVPPPSLTRRSLIPILAALALTTLAAPVAYADYFHDQGFNSARIRTDFDAQNEGTAANPLTIVSPCLWPPGTPNMIDPICRTGPNVYPQSNAFSQNGGYQSSRYWTLILNNEPWFDARNSGPPGQSLPRALPGHGVMGFNALKNSIPGETFWRAHMVLNHTFQNPVNQLAIPYMSLHTDQFNGNGTVLGALNDPTRPHEVQFTSKLWDYFLPSGPGVLSHHMYVRTEWGGKPRFLFLQLFHHNIAWSYPWLPGLNRKWHWNFPASSFFPGGDLAYYDADDTLTHCQNFYVQPMLYKGHQVTYRIDLQKAFRCASDNNLFDTPMPTNQVLPIRTIGWANEITGDGAALWTSVHGMRMLPGERLETRRDLSPALEGSVLHEEVIPSSMMGPEAAAIRDALTNGCRANEECYLTNKNLLDGSAEAPALDAQREQPFDHASEVRGLAPAAVEKD